MSLTTYYVVAICTADSFDLNVVLIIGFNNLNQGIVEPGLTRLGFNNSNQGIVEQGLTWLG